MKFATLVIDLQQGLAQGAYQIEQVLANTNKVIAHTREQGGLVIAIPKMDVVYLRGTVLDYLESEAGSGFDFKNPRARREG